MTPGDYETQRRAAGLDPQPTILLGERLRELRTEALMTLAELAEICGQSGQGVTYKWETGESTPELEMQWFLADLFGVTLDYLVGRDGYERDSYRVMEAKRQLRERLTQQNLAGLSRPQRVAKLWHLAQEVAPTAFPLRRVAGLSGLKEPAFRAIIEQGVGHISDSCTARFAYALGLPVEALRDHR